MDNRNLLLAVVLSGLLILGWDVGMRYFYPQASLSAPMAASDPAAKAPSQGAPGTVKPAADLGGDPAPARKVDLTAALASPERVAIDTPRLAGSINLVGARIDDIVLKDYRQTVKKGSGPVRLFAPESTPDQYFAEFGFVTNGVRQPSDARWQADGGKLTPTSPVTLTRTDADGITYRIRLTVDKDYMITAEQTAVNAGTTAATVQPFAFIKRTSANAGLSTWTAHTGPIFAADDVASYEVSYKCGWTLLSTCYGLTEDKLHKIPGKADWLGFTDQYWFAALVPGAAAASADFRKVGDELFRADVLYAPITLPAGKAVTRATRLFSGAKESALLDRYEDSGIAKFGLAITWGWFWFFEKPFLWLLRTLNSVVGNFGVAIILLTVIIRGLMFPVAQRQFASMAQMKAVQPKMKAIQERFKDDKQRQQQEIMKLYKEEKVNPLAGCLPMVIQIPVFFALYKVLVLAIEMRHEPFVLWIKDLSAPDPAHILNLFGLLPFVVPEHSFLAIGPLAVLLGITMFLTFKLNPSTMDPVQQQMFSFMPWILMFVMAPFAAGLLIYWVTSNLLTLAQQTYLYSRHPQLKAANVKAKEEEERKKPAKG
ncbi:MAG: membrane protein insertase YidC [Porphyrobacter sp.]|nr:membrane protein insertase YidC [Porphyrobacter sp.]